MATIFGESGDDTLTGTSGADTIYGLAGDDISIGWQGNETYIFDRGDGQDTIFDNDGGSGEVNTLQFGQEFRNRK